MEGTIKTNVQRIKEITESNCDFIDTVTVSEEIPLVEASRLLVKSANNAVKVMLGKPDPILAGELLLLAGYNCLLFTQGKELTNIAVHFTGLKMQGNELPTQSIYLAMKEAKVKEEEERDSKKESPRRTIKRKPRKKKDELPWYDPKFLQGALQSITGEAKEPPQMVSAQEVAIPPDTNKEQVATEEKKTDQATWYDVQQLQAMLDAETPAEILDAAEEFRMSSNRLSDKPSLGDTPMTAPASYIRQNQMQVPMNPGGIKGALGQ